MTRTLSTLHPRCIVAVIIALAVLCTRCHDPAGHEATITRLSLVDSSIAARPTGFPGERERLAASDPLGFLRICREHYLSTVTDYRCRFHIRERLSGALTDEQEIAVLYRENPYSVHMRWVRNPRRASSVSYVEGRWVNDGCELALIHPSGVLGLLVPGGVKRDIHGWEARAAATRTIDQFGFRNTLELIIKYCELARGDPAYDLRYRGLASLNGRVSYVFERRLPYTEPDDPYPNRLLVICIDRDWLVPTGCFAYADDAGEVLLGTYVTTQVEFNVGLADADF